MSTQTTRPYVVYTKGVELPRLVIAAHPAQALRHCADATFTVQTPNALEVSVLMSKGIKLEEVGVTDSREPELPLDGDPQ